MSGPVERRPEPGELIAGLLGPAGPELSCEQCFERLDVYVEAELRGADAEAAAPGMGAHLRGCPACAEDRRSLRALLEDARPSWREPPATTGGMGACDRG